MLTIKIIFGILFVIILGSKGLFKFSKMCLKTKQEHYEIIRNIIINKTNPEKQLLLELINHKKFKYEKDTFQKAVFTKLDAYNIVPTIIEKTMSPVQLYKANNPLWTNGLSLDAVEAFLTLNDELQKNNITIDVNEHMEGFIINCKNGIKPEDALNKLLEQQRQKLQKQIQEHTLSLENKYRNLFQHQ